VRIIYEPRGRAAEYAKLAASGYRYCNHGCRYCFNPLALHCTAEDFLKPVVRQGVLTAFEKDCKELAAAGDQREILLSFSTDPYNELEERYHITRSMIALLIEYGLHFTTLTKGTMPPEDLDLMQQRPDLCRYGTTLTFLSAKDRELWEPNATPGVSRVNALREAAGLGIRTWASIEPVIYPRQSLELIRLAIPYCQEFRIGKFNHTGSKVLQEFMTSIGYAPPTEAQLAQFVDDAGQLLGQSGRKCIFKKDLQPYLSRESRECPRVKYEVPE
jgi:DNA repair photolyase